MIGAVLDERAFSTDNYIRAVKGERQDPGEDRDVTNYVKLQGILNIQGAF